MKSDDSLFSSLRVLRVRDESLLLHSDRVALYGVETKAFNPTVRRNVDRFPRDFAFQLTNEEWTALRSQTVTLNPSKRGQHWKYLPWVVTEHGAIMAASLLNSERAIATSRESNESAPYDYPRQRRSRPPRRVSQLISIPNA